MEAPTIRVMLSGIAGDLAELDMDAGSTADDLKQRVSDECGVPPACQKLLVATTVLAGTEELAAHCRGAGGGSSLRVVLVLVLDGVIADLEDPDRGTRLAAVRGIAALGTRGGEDAVRALAGCVDDEEYHVRKAAVESLVAVSERGDELAYHAMRTFLHDEDEDVRAAAVRALVHVVRRGDEGAVEALTARLEDEHWQVRKAAVQALLDVAEDGDKDAIDKVRSRIEDSNDDVRRTAAHAMLHAGKTERGAQGAIDSLMDVAHTLLKDQRWWAQGAKDQSCTECGARSNLTLDASGTFHCARCWMMWVERKLVP